MTKLKNEFAFLNSTINQNLRFKDDFGFALGCLTVCVTGAGAGVDSAWEQKKLEARKLLENAAESPASSVSMQAQSGRVAVGHVFGYAPFVQ